MKNLLWILALSTSLFAQSICIDPGHGGSDPGAVGWGLQEKNINLDVSQRIYKLMRQSGWTAYLVRSSDKTVSLSGRTSYANSLGVKRFVSIHCNAFNKSANGTETFAYTKGSSASFAMRNSVHPRLVRAMNTKDRGTKTANFYVIKHTNMPAILAELAFIDQKSDSAKLGDSYYRQKAAEAIHSGIVSSLAAIDQEIESANFYMAPKWSPNGNTLMITRPGYNNISILNIDNANIESIAAVNAYNAQWVSNDEIRCGNKNDLQLLNVVTGSSVRTFANNDVVFTSIKDGALTINHHGEEYIIAIEKDIIFNAVISPDQKRVAYESLYGGVHVADINGQNATNIGQGNNPVWTPDSQSIVFDRALDNGHEITESNLFMTQIGSRQLTNLTEKLSVIAQRPSVSPNGDKIAFDADGSIFIADLKQGQIVQVLQVTE